MWFLPGEIFTSICATVLYTHLFKCSLSITLIAKCSSSTHTDDFDQVKYHTCDFAPARNPHRLDNLGIVQLCARRKYVSRREFSPSPQRGVMLGVSNETNWFGWDALFCKIVCCCCAFCGGWKAVQHKWRGQAIAKTQFLTAPHTGWLHKSQLVQYTSELWYSGIL